VEAPLRQFVLPLRVMDTTSLVGVSVGGRVAVSVRVGAIVSVGVTAAVMVCCISTAAAVNVPATRV